jgi:hypothetical protein
VPTARSTKSSSNGLDGRELVLTRYTEPEPELNLFGGDEIEHAVGRRDQPPRKADPFRLVTVEELVGSRLPGTTTMRYKSVFSAICLWMKSASSQSHKY